MPTVLDSHRHIGLLPAYPFYGGPPMRADTDGHGDGRGLHRQASTRTASSARWCCPTTACPIPDVAFGLNHLALEAAAAATTGSAAGCGSRPRPPTRDRNDRGARAGRRARACAALKTELPARRRPDRPRLRRAARPASSPPPPSTTSSCTCTPRPGAASDIDQVGTLVEKYGDDDQDPPRPPRRRDERPHEAHRRPLLRLDRGRQAGLHRHQLGDRLRPDLAGRRDRETRGRPRPRSSSPPTPRGATTRASTPGCRAAAGDGDLAGAFFTENFAALYG